MEDAVSSTAAPLDLVQDTMARYRAAYGSEPEIVATAPGRVNLIGEHTDYNDGFVLPVAIDRRVIIAAGRRPDDILALSAVNIGASTTVELSRPAINKNALWAKYSVGVASILQKRGYPVSGANFCIRGTIPLGAGLSSSAALEVASAIIFRQMNRLSIPPIDLIHIARAAETEFVGVQCGIMDQFASVMAVKDHALFLDCRSLEFSHVRFPEGVSLVICDTGVRRELARSAYNQRKAECQEAVLHLASRLGGITSLRDVSVGQFQELEQELSPVARKRAWHVISENERVLKSVAALKEKNLTAFGSLMLESHASLRDSYEVSCPELDAFVEIAEPTPGVYGARMTGAGFGGCAICIVDEEEIDTLVERLRTEYPKHAGRSLTIYVASPDEGAAVIFPQESLIAIGAAQLQ